VGIGLERAGGGAIVIAAAEAADHAAPVAGGGFPPWFVATALVALALAALGVAGWRGWLRMPEALAPPAPPSAGVPLVVLAMAMPLVAGLGAAFARRWTGPDEDGLGGQVALLAAAGLAQLPAAIGIVLLLPPRTRGAASVARALLVGAVAWGLAFPVVQAVALAGGWIQDLLTGVPPPAIAHHTLERLVADAGTPAAWAMLGLVTLAVPALEEIAYRGGLQGGMRSLGFTPWTATIATSGVFTLMHVGAVPADGRGAALSGLFVLSLALGLVRERTGSLVAPFLLHALFNLANVLVARS